MENPTFTNQNNADTSSSEELKIRISEPADAVPIGNGRLGAMVGGGVQSEILQLNEDTLWTGNPENYTDAAAPEGLSEVRILVNGGMDAIATDVAVKLSGKDITRKEWMMLFIIPVLSAGLSLINKRALTNGMDFRVLCTYRNVVASCVLAPCVYWKERSSWKLLTWSVVWRLVVLGLLEPMLDQLLLYAGMTYMPVSLSASIGLLQPVVTLVMCCIFRVERIKLRAWPSQAKLLGALVAITGACLILLSPLKKEFSSPWKSNSTSTGHGNTGNNVVTGFFLCTLAMISASVYGILLENTQTIFECPFSITACTCFVGAVGNALLGTMLGIDRSEFSLEPLQTLSVVAYLYSGILVSALSSYLVALVIRTLGTVTLGAVTPLSTVIVTLVSYLAFGEPLPLIRVIGILVLALGMSLILFGKHLDRKSAEGGTDTRRRGEAREADAHVLLITNDRENQMKATEEGIIDDTVKSLSRPDLLDLIVQPTMEDASMEEAEDLTMSEITSGLQHRGVYHQGKLCVNRDNPFEAYVGSENIGDEIIIHGSGNMNRAFDGDVVAQDQWQEEKSLSIVEEDDDGEEDVHLAPSSADDAPRTSNVVQISAGDSKSVSSSPSGRLSVSSNETGTLIVDL